MCDKPEENYVIGAFYDYPKILRKWCLHPRIFSELTRRPVGVVPLFLRTAGSDRISFEKSYVFVSKQRGKLAETG